MLLAAGARIALFGAICTTVGTTIIAACKSEHGRSPDGGHGYGYGDAGNGYGDAGNGYGYGYGNGYGSGYGSGYGNGIGNGGR
jgi:hypothetical protein